MTEFCVEFRGVEKSWNETKVIQGVSLGIARNLTTALVGESGSGKSTLLQIINGLVRPDLGEVLVDGEPLNYAQLPLIRRRMGYAVQGGGLFPHLNVKRNVTLMAELEGWSASAINNRYRQLNELLELPAELSARYPHSLSGGQQQRVSLCRAMMLNPALLLLDEPFSALDPITREAIHGEFIRLQLVESRSIILVTHDLSEAVKLAQQLVILKDGMIVRQGGIDEVRAAPDDYTAQLFATAGLQ